MSDHTPGATEVLPRLAAGDSHATRPLISLIVPVWNDDELVVDLVSGLQVVPELAEWVVAAVQPGERLLRVAPSRNGSPDFLRQTLARQTDECRSSRSARVSTVLSSCRFRVASRAPERIGKNRKERSNLRWSIPPSLRRSTLLCRLVGRFNSTRQFVRWAAVWRSVHLRSIICF